MKIGIIGSGALGANVARALAKQGLSATLSNQRGPASLASLVAAVRWSSLGQALGGLPAWNNRIVIDGTNPVQFLDPDSPDAKDPSNPLAAYGIKAIDLGDRSSSEVFREFVPGARVVKALNHLDVSVLPQPQVSGGQRVQFYSGDDAAAKAEVRQLLEAIGYFPVDLGSLAVGGRLAELPFGPLAATNFIKI